MAPGGLPDRQLAKRLQRDAQLAAKAHARTEKAYARAVARRERKLREARRALPVGLTAALGGSLLLVPADGGTSAFLTVVAVAGGARAWSALRTLRNPPPVPERPPLALGPLPAPPPLGSAAFPAVRRLEAVREQLRELLPLVAPAGRPAADEAWHAAAEADVALRWQASRIAAVEAHRGADPLASGRLQDATDAVHGLAQGLREVR